MLKYYTKASDAARALAGCDSKFNGQYAIPYSVKQLRDKKSKNNLIQNSLATTAIGASSIIAAPLTTAINNKSDDSREDTSRFFCYIMFYIKFLYKSLK